MSTFRSENFYDFVASGCVWSGDSYASTRNGSLTAAVVYIAGVRLAVSAVSAHLFTASKDTYTDVNGSGVVVYTEATNNAASPALTAGSIRVGIIITGASSIAAATSVNQGQETMILPIASSIAYSVTDSLGNLICPRDINRKLLGYRQIISSFVTSAQTPTLVTGLTVPVINPSNRKIKITLHGPSTLVNALGSSLLAIYDTSVGGTQLQIAKGTSGGASYATDMTAIYMGTPASGSKTYVADYHVDSNQGTLTASSTEPVFLMVELE